VIHSAPPAQKGKNKTRRAATEGHGIGNTGEGKEGVLWEVVTEDTVIFPEGMSSLTLTTYRPSTEEGADNRRWSTY
jgi:hypothetical protein